MAQRTVVIGFLGTQLDTGRSPARWSKWRPSVALFQHEDLVIHRLELLHTAPFAELARQVVADIAAVSPETTVNLVRLELQDPWDFGEVYAVLYDWSRGYAFDTDRERYWAHITTGTHVAQICLFLMVEARFLPGVLLQTSPPRPQGLGEPGSYTLIDLDLSRYDALAQRFGQAQRDALAHLKGGIATRNPAFNALIEEIERVAVNSRAPLLLVGPTGAGKSLLARRLYELKRERHRVEGAFVEVNCATLHGDGAMSALFGHQRGAFTGAATARAGLLRAADRGVLFLDEIGELGPDEQAMLLKAIEDRRFYPLGADREVGSDFQLIAATHRDLRADLASGRFREDLFARINLWTWHLPGLAERREDIEPHLDHLIAACAQERGQALRLAGEARQRYLAWAQSDEAPWRGNFRDLSASVTRLATLADGGRISLALVEAEIARLRWLWSGDEAALRQPTSTPALGGVSAADAEPAEPVELADLLAPATLAGLDQFDRLQLQAVLGLCRRCRTLSEAGRQLFDVSRRARSVVNDADRLRKYLARFGLDWAALQEAFAGQGR
ncbi:MAG TPA: RNA repair transcriptional activator RtcR [Burkholderiaceae bacterium]|nr:RNA repair transcriptional activator RtcR [Burkholderiaceae bacterium]HNB43030.1 RNA repair transcriptional activator RtcR [Burkholderiaceae bacterium]